ncbi:hypothetical protein EV360DRAFT_67590 [Lentinula raphanica]|nr:hypothetical protein EV360DRAFT_67590 [Lentinula raphanica]
MMLSVRRQVWTGTGLVLSVLLVSVVLTSAYPMGHSGSNNLAGSASAPPPPPSGSQHHAPHARHPHSEAVIDLGSSPEHPWGEKEEKKRACRICSDIAAEAWEKLGFSGSGEDKLHCTGYPGDWTYNGWIDAVLRGPKICGEAGCTIKARRQPWNDPEEESPFYDGEITYVGVDDTGKEVEVVVVEVKRLEVESEADRVRERKARKAEEARKAAEEAREAEEARASHKHHHHHHHHR